MNAKEIKDYLDNNSEVIQKVVNRILYKNQDYNAGEIRNMAITALLDSKIPTQKELYLKVLNRVLEEKGYKYNKNELVNPLVRAEETSQLENNPMPEDFDNESFELLDEVFANADLTQEEVFVTALSFNLSTPVALKGKYKKILDNIEDVYYNRILTKKEIASIMKVSVRQMERYRSIAFEKMEKYCEIARLHRTGRHKK